MPFLFKLSKRVARLRSRVLLVAAAAVAGACAKEVASPAGEKTPVAIQISALDVKPGGSIAVVLRATQPLAAIQETVAFDPQRLHYERQGDGPDLVVVNDEAAAQGSLKVLATNPQGLASPGVTLVFTVTASGYTEGIGGTLELAVGPDDRLVWGTAPSAADRAAGTSPAGSYRFGDVNLDGQINHPGGSGRARFPLSALLTRRLANHQAPPENPAASESTISQSWWPLFHRNRS